MKPLKTKTKVLKPDYQTLLDLPFSGMVLKGFMIPNGYQLTIQTKDGDVKTLNPGEYSGSVHSFSEVLQGQVEGWTLTQIQAPSQPPSPFEKYTPDDPAHAVVIEQAYKFFAKEGLNMEPIDFINMLFSPSPGINPADVLKPEIAAKIKEVGPDSILIYDLEKVGAVAPKGLDSLLEVVKGYKEQKETKNLPSIGKLKPKAAPIPIVTPLELKLAVTPRKLTQAEERIISSKIARLVYGISDMNLKGLVSLYTSINSPSDLNRMVAKSERAKILNEVRRMDDNLPFASRVGMAIATLYPDSMFEQKQGQYANYEYSTQTLSVSERESLLKKIPQEIRQYLGISAGISTKGELARLLGENLVDDFGLFEEERDYEGPAPKMTDPLDIRQIPKYKIKGMTDIESRMKHIMDVATPEALNLFDDSIEGDERTRLNGVFMGGTNSGSEYNSLGMSATKYIHSTLMEYVSSMPNCLDARELIYAWSTGKWGASSAIGFALRFLESDSVGRRREDEFGYDKYVKTNRAFSEEINDKMDLYAETYRQLKKASGELIDAVFPDGVDVYRGFSALGEDSIEKYIGDNAIMMSALSCFSTSKATAEQFSHPDEVTPDDISKRMIMHTKVRGKDVGMIPSLAVRDRYRYSLGNGTEIYPEEDEPNVNFFMTEKELTILGPDAYPFYSADTKRLGYDEHYADIEIRL